MSTDHSVDDSSELTLVGTVVSGSGEGARFTALEWARAAFEQQLGFEPWPGTLNLQVIGTGWAEALRRSGPESGIPIVPPDGYCAARCFPALVAGRIHGAVVRPEVDGYPDDKLELLAPVFLRRALELADGDTVELHVTLRPTVGGSP